MASTGAVMYVRPRLAAGVVPGRKTGAVMRVRPRLAASVIPNRKTAALMYVAVRGVSGAYGVGVTDSADRRLADAWLPSAGTPLGWVVVNGQRFPVHIDVHSWYRFLNTVAEVKLGGFTGSTVPDVVAAVETTQAEAVTSARRVSAITSQALTNAEALASAREVIVNNALVGASQIPEVQLAPGEQIP